MLLHTMRTGVTLWRTPRKWCTHCTPSLGEWIMAGNSLQVLYCFFLNRRGVASYVKSQHYSVTVLMSIRISKNQVTFVVFRDHQQNPNSHMYLWHLCIPRPCTTPMYHAHVPRPCTTPMYHAVVCTYCTSYLTALRCVWVF